MTDQVAARAKEAGVILTPRSKPEPAQGEQLAMLQKQSQMLQEFVRENGLAKNFGGPKDHLFFEAWQFLGSLGGYTASIKTTTDKMVNGKTVGVEAEASLYHNGDWVLDVKNACCRDEANWRQKPYYQLLSMAETRAMSKAYRSKVAYIVSLAGYSATPAEEMILPPKENGDE